MVRKMAKPKVTDENSEMFRRLRAIATYELNPIRKSKPTHEAFCKELGISKAMYYKYKACDRYYNVLFSESRKVIKGLIPDVVKSLHRLIKAGEPKTIRWVLETLNVLEDKSESLGDVLKRVVNGEIDERLLVRKGKFNIDESDEPDEADDFMDEPGAFEGERDE